MICRRTATKRQTGSQMHAACRAAVRVLIVCCLRLGRVFGPTHSYLLSLKAAALFFKASLASRSRRCGIPAVSLLGLNQNCRACRGDERCPSRSLPAIAHLQRHRSLPDVRLACIESVPEDGWIEAPRHRCAVRRVPERRASQRSATSRSS